MNFDGLREPEHITFLRSHELFKTWPVHKLPWFDPSVCIFTFIRYIHCIALRPTVETFAASFSDADSWYIWKNHFVTPITRHIEAFAMTVHVKVLLRCRRGLVMSRSLDEAEWIYVIVTGSCRVLTTLRATRPNLPTTSYGQQNDVIGSPLKSMRVLTIENLFLNTEEKIEYCAAPLILPCVCIPARLTQKPHVDLRNDANSVAYVANGSQQRRHQQPRERSGRFSDSRRPTIRVVQLCLSVRRCVQLWCLLSAEELQRMHKRRLDEIAAEATVIVRNTHIASFGILI